MHSVRRVLLVVGSIAALTAIAAPAAAQAPTITEVVGGLNAPRGVAVGADGTIFVAEAGAGGTEPCVEHPELGKTCFGPTGGISAVTGGVATRLVDGLVSAVSATGDVIGPSDVTVDADGVVWYLIGGPGAGAADGRAGVPDGAAAGMGQLYRVDADGDAQSVADLAAYETANNPDAAQPGNEMPDSNANGVATTPDGAAVADAGANSLLLVDGDGNISVAAVFPVVMMPMPVQTERLTRPSCLSRPGRHTGHGPIDPAPTSVAVGPDGATTWDSSPASPSLLVAASVFRVVPGEEPTVYASGFTNIMDVAFRVRRHALRARDRTRWSDGRLRRPGSRSPAGRPVEGPARWWHTRAHRERGTPDAGWHGRRRRWDDLRLDVRDLRRRVTSPRWSTRQPSALTAGT